MRGFTLLAGEKVERARAALSLLHITLSRFKAETSHFVHMFSRITRIPCNMLAASLLGFSSLATAMSVVGIGDYVRALDTRAES